MVHLALKEDTGMACSGIGCGVPFDGTCRGVRTGSVHAAGVRIRGVRSGGVRAGGVRRGLGMVYRAPA